MFIALHSLACFVLCISGVSAIALQPQLESPTQSSLDPSKASAIANATSLDLVGLNATTDISCLETCGRNLDIDSCNNARDKIPQDSARLTFGLRGTGNWNVLLPARYLSDDGLCAININFFWNPLQAQAISTYAEIALAADSLIDICVKDPFQNMGGAIWNLGMPRVLTAEIWKQTPAVACIATRPASAPSYDSCKEIIDKMPWSERILTFGKRGVPSVEVPVPKVIASTDRECMMVVFNIGGASRPVDQGSWSDVWQAAVAVNEMCVKNSKTGTSMVNSRLGNLRVMFGKREPPDWNILSGLNMTASDLSILSGPDMTLPTTND